MVKVLALEGQAAIDCVTGSHGPEIQIAKGGHALTFNADLDMLGAPAHLERWARRWGPILRNDKALVSNSYLDKREWAELDRTIIEMVKLRRNGVQDLVDAGLVRRSNLGVMLSQWRVSSERVRPTVNMDGRSRANRDRTDRAVFGVPLPIFRTDYEFGMRELLAGRKLGAPIDTHEAGEAASAIAEEEERTLFLGNANIVVQGDAIFGYTTLAARDTATAAAYGGGDFGTISNILPTYLGMLTALAAVRYHGPFVSYVANTQYHQMLETFTDGSGQTGLQRVLELPQITKIQRCDFVVAGTVLLVQMTSNVVDWEIALSVENREWETPDGQALHFAVMSAGAPRLKSDFAGNAGIAHATAA